MYTPAIPSPSALVFGGSSFKRCHCYVSWRMSKMHVDIYGNLKALARSLYYTGYSFCLLSYDEIVLLLDLIIYSLHVQRPRKLDLFSSCFPSLNANDPFS